MENETRKYKELWIVEDRPATATKPAKSYWTKVGVAFEGHDGSWNMHLIALPVNGRLVMRDPISVAEQAMRDASVPRGAVA